MTGKLAKSWKDRAARVGALLPRERMHPMVVEWAENHARSAWAVAFSGGADSLALLLVLWANWPERRGRLLALHFNHMLRGRASDADERFCRDACAELGVGIRVGRWSGARRGASEAEARAARHGFFGVELKRAACSALWLAHQQDDIAESMLMRLARGSGPGGMAAPRPVQVMGDRRTHLRPLLTLKKSQLIQALRESGCKWREDASNLRDDFFRNRIRAKVVPAWIDAAGRDALAGAALSRARMEEDDRALESWADALAPFEGRRRIYLERLDGVPTAVVRRILHRWLLSAGSPVDLSRQGFDVLLAAVERGKATRFSLGQRLFAVIRQGHLEFVREPDRISAVKRRRTRSTRA